MIHFVCRVSRLQKNDFGIRVDYLKGEVIIGAGERARAIYEGVCAVGEGEEFPPPHTSVF